MKKSLILVGMLSIGYAYAQEGNVGINTDNPRATLEITPSTPNLTGTTNEGIIAPNLSKTRIANIATPVEGTLVYATDATYAGTNAKVSKITEKGYYFYNGTEWVKASAGADTNTNIYTSNGTLTEHRTVDMAGRNLLFTNNGRIGIGTTTPSSALTIEGTGGWNDDFTINTFGNTTGGFALFTNKYRGTAENRAAVEAGDSLGVLNFRGYNGTAIANGVNISTVVSEVEGEKIKANLIINPTKNVGIGNSSPRARLDVYNSETNLDIPILALGTRNNTNNHVSKGIELYTDNSNFPAAIDVVRGASSGFTGLSFMTSQGVTDTRTEKMRIQPNGYVGIGTNEPSSRLDVMGAIRAGGDRENVRTELTGGGIEIFRKDPNGTPSKNIGHIDFKSDIGIDADIRLYANKNIDDNKLFFRVQGSSDGTLSGATTKTPFNVDLTDGRVGINTTVPTEALEVRGNIKTSSLAGTGDRVVYADANGVLKTGGSIAANNGLQNEATMTCNDANRGKMNFVKDVTLAGGGKADAFAVCLKGSDGNHYWRYLYGAGGETTASGNFGTGLQ